jgi:hypothetical protein
MINVPTRGAGQNVTQRLRQQRGRGQTNDEGRDDTTSQPISVSIGHMQAKGRVVVFSKRGLQVPEE